MLAWCKLAKAEFRALLSGWLAVALLAPMLLGAAPQQVLTPADGLAYQIEQAICSQSGDPHQTQDQHRTHDHDCCLPGTVAAQLAPDVTPGTGISVPQLRFAALHLDIWATPAHHPHESHLGIPRGPPSFSSSEA
jgi:hypothetical protein